LQSLLPERRYFLGITDGSAKQTIDGIDDKPFTKPGGTIGLVSRTFSYGNDHDRFSFNVNGTIRNAKGYCLEVDSDVLGAEITVEDCAADFLGYETENPLLERQTWYEGSVNWEPDESGKKVPGYQLKTKAGYCLGVAVTEFCQDNDSMCIRWKNNGECDSNINAQNLCPKSCGQCNLDEGDRAVQYDPSDSIDLTLVPCNGNRKKTYGEYGTPEAFYFNLPTAESFQERLDWACNVRLKPICAAIPGEGGEREYCYVKQHQH
jgi:hypothetical protein